MTVSIPELISAQRPVPRFKGVVTVVITKDTVPCSGHCEFTASLGSTVSSLDPLGSLVVHLLLQPSSLSVSQYYNRKVVHPPLTHIRSVRAGSLP